MEGNLEKKNIGNPFSSGLFGNKNEKINPNQSKNIQPLFSTNNNLNKPAMTSFLNLQKITGFISSNIPPQQNSIFTSNKNQEINKNINTQKNQNLIVINKKEEEKEKSFEDFIEKISKKLKKDKPSNFKLTKTIDKNAKLTNKILEDLIEDTFDKIDIGNNFPENSNPNFSSNKKIKQLKPNFSVYSNKLELQFLFLPFNPNNILLIFSKEKFVKKLELIFDQKNKDNNYNNNNNILNKNNFLVDKITMNQVNQNELAFFSEKKIAILTDIANLINSNETKIKFDFILTINDLNNYYINTNTNTNSYYNTNTNENNLDIKFLQFYFWDFDKHFGILTNDNKIRIFNYHNKNKNYNDNENDTYIDIELIYELDSDLVKSHLELKNQQLNFTDFQFANIETSHFLEAFSIIILDYTGRVFYVKYIFPLEINLSVFENINFNIYEIKTFIKFLEIYKKENIQKFKINYKNYDFNRNPNKIKDKELIKENEKEIKNYFEKESFIIDTIISLINNNKENNNLINIKDLLNIFNRNEYVTIEELNIKEKEKENVENFSKLERIKKEFHSNKFKNINTNTNFNINQNNYFSKIKLITTTPLSFIRMNKNDNIDIILSDKEIFAEEINEIDNKKDNKNNAYVILNEKFYSKVFSKVENDIFSEKLFLIDNYLNKNHYIIINYINDIYLLNLKFLKKISKNFLKKKTQKIFEKKFNSNTLNLIPYLKFDYSKIKNFDNQIFGYFGINFFSLKKNINKNNFILFGLNYENENNKKFSIFSREFKLYKNEKDIYEDFDFYENKEKFEKKIFTEEELSKQLDLKVSRKIRENYDQNRFVSLNKIRDQ
jgi:hypothetical protein